MATSHFSKADIGFWQKAVFRQPYTVDGRRWLTKEWYARIQFRGKLGSEEARAGEGIQDCLLLLYMLAAQELRRRAAAIRGEAAVRRGGGIGREGPRSTETPDRIVLRKELLATLQTATLHWPKNEHELFNLYFIEGFEADEIAMVQGRPFAKVEKDLREMQAKFRALLTDESRDAVGTVTHRATLP